MDVGNISGLVNGLWQVVDDSGELAAAATSYSISGLEGDTADEYMVIARFINGYSGAVDYRVRFNSDTGGNYGSQEMSGINATSAAVRTPTVASISLADCVNLGETNLSILNISSKSGYIRTANSSHATGITGTTVVGRVEQGHVWNNSADEITDIDVIADQTDGIGIGSRIVTVKKVDVTAVGHMKTGSLDVKGTISDTIEMIYENDLTVTTTTVSITGLTGDTDILYLLKVFNVDGAPTPSDIDLRFNNDTGANYGYQRFVGQAAVATAARVSAATRFPMIVGSATANLTRMSETLIHAKSGYERAALSQYMNGIVTTTVGSIELRGVVWDNTADEITSLVLNATVNGGLGIGSRVELWKVNL